MKNTMKIDTLLCKSVWKTFLFCEGSLNSDDHVFICELCHWALVNNPSVERYSLSLRIKPPCNHYFVEANVYRRSITHGCLLLEM